MLKFFDYLNEKTNNTYKDSKLVSVIYDNDTDEITLKFLYTEGSFSDDDKKKIRDLFIEYIPFNFDKVVVKAKKSYIDERIVEGEVYKYMVRYHQTLDNVFEPENVKATGNEQHMLISISVPTFHYDFLVSRNFEMELLDYLDMIFFGNFEIQLIDTDVKSNYENILSTSAENMASHLDEIVEKPVEIKYNKVINIQKYTGRDINGNPMQIASIVKPYDTLEIAGKIAFFTEKSFVKGKDDKGREIRKLYYSFMLNDGSGKFNCVYFPTKADADRAKNLADGDEVILTGSVESFNDRLNFKVMGVSMCNVLAPIVEEKPVEEPKMDIVKEPFDKYRYVQPERYIDMTQCDMFSMDDDVCDYCKTHDIVVFDLETTGIDPVINQIIEIGAVKIRDGKIYETFSVLIRPDPISKREPDKYIPPEITDITGITDDMVKDCYTIDKILPDFYKFTYGCTIIAYNINFDYRFLSVAGIKNGYVFENKQIDALLMARQHVVGAKTFSLGNICKILGVSLENAHRAVHDAIATAEVVIKLSQFLHEYDSE